MKTKDAFALRDFDTERILQRNFFIEEHDDTVYIESDTEKLDTVDARNVAHLGSAEMVKHIAKLQEFKSAVANYKRLLDVHKNRLESLATCYAKKFTETAAQIWQEKYRRAQNLQQAYSNAITALCNLQEKITKLEQSGEKAIDQQRRKEFANQLKDARQKAGMKQSDVAGKVKVASTTIANYEQGRADPQIPLLVRICYALNCSADELLGLK